MRRFCILNQSLAEKLLNQTSILDVKRFWSKLRAMTSKSEMLKSKHQPEGSEKSEFVDSGECQTKSGASPPFNPFTNIVLLTNGGDRQPVAYVLNIWFWNAFHVHTSFQHKKMVARLYLKICFTLFLSHIFPLSPINHTMSFVTTTHFFSICSPFLLFWWLLSFSTSSRSVQTTHKIVGFTPESMYLFSDIRPVIFVSVLGR